MNVKLLRRIQKFLLREPRRFNMYEGVVNSLHVREQLEQPPCGTACCIAGAAYVLVNKIEKELHSTNRSWLYVLIDAERSLDLTDEQVQKLFYIKAIHHEKFGWPQKFEGRYLKAKTAKQRAKVGVARIEHFIKTNGAE